MSQPALRSRLLSVAPICLIGLLATVAGSLVTSPETTRWAVAAGIIALLLAIVTRSPLFSILFLMAWLVCLGTLRRMLSAYGVASPLGDPLLLVAPAMWVILAIDAISKGALQNRTRLTNTVLTLIALLTISVMNPWQGGITVGLAGWMLVVPPMLAFIVGRVVHDKAFGKILGLIGILAVPGAIYGLLQTYKGFPSWDEQWITDYGYIALNVGTTIRPFSSFSSAAEYASFLGVGVVAWLSSARKPAIRSLALAVIALLGMALWLGAVRTLILLTIVAVGAIAAARRAVPLRWAVVGGLALLIALPAIVGRLAPQGGAGPTGDLAAHSVAGLSDPFGEKSTLTPHLRLVTQGISTAFRNPFGAGVGSVTVAAGKYGGTGKAAEADPGDIALAAGLPGLLSYLVIAVLGLRLAYRLATQRRDAFGLAALGILVVTLFHWLTGGQYSTAPLPWLVLGWLDAQVASRVERAPARELDWSGSRP